MAPGKAKGRAQRPRRESDATHKNVLKKLVRNGHSAIGYVPYVACKTEFFFVQLESEESNLNASLFSWLSSRDVSLESLCLDHFTGG